MTHTQSSGREPESTQTRPWYRYPWPWVAIAIPGLAVAGGLYTPYLAITHPDPLVVDEGRYQEMRAELQADPQARSPAPATDDGRHNDEQDH